MGAHIIDTRNINVPVDRIDGANGHGVNFTSVVAVDPAEFVGLALVHPSASCPAVSLIAQAPYFSIGPLPTAGALARALSPTPVGRRPALRSIGLRASLCALCIDDCRCRVTLSTDPWEFERSDTLARSSALHALRYEPVNPSAARVAARITRQHRGRARGLPAFELLRLLRRACRVLCRWSLLRR
eukprot:6179259-Pleurochrysis_carterae.AAC.4